MGRKPMKYISDIELKKAYKRSKILTTIQAVLVIIMLVFAILITIEKGLSVFTFLPLFFGPMVIIGVSQMNKFKKEIKRRENS